MVFVVIGLCLEYSSKHEFAPEDAVVSGKLEKIEKAFNYNFINDNEFYYFTYPKNTDSYSVNMYKYNMEKD